MGISLVHVFLEENYLISIPVSTTLDGHTVRMTAMHEAARAQNAIDANNPLVTPKRLDGDYYSGDDVLAMVQARIAELMAEQIAREVNEDVCAIAMRDELRIQAALTLLQQD